MILLYFLNSRQEVLVISLLLCLQLGEVLGVVEHLAGVLVSLVLDFVLLLVEKLSALHLFGVLRLLDLSEQGLFLVLCLLLLGDELGLLLGDG